MNVNLILQQIIGGLTIGAVYSLIALGFTMMLRASELINFAQGEMVMLGAFFGWTLYALLPQALPFWMVFFCISKSCTDPALGGARVRTCWIEFAEYCCVSIF